MTCLLIIFSFYSYAHHSDLHSFPTRRSSDLVLAPDTPSNNPLLHSSERRDAVPPHAVPLCLDRRQAAFLPFQIDRKSTRLNSSHTVISYAVFCLKKKKTTKPLSYFLQRSPHA